MLSDNDAVATIPVKDIEVARNFYENTLGMKDVTPGGPGLFVCKSGNSRILVYESQHAGTNEATAVTWTVGDDIEVIVQTLGAKGVTFEHYDVPGATRDGDVHVMGRHKGAWFRDPDGNILHIVN